MPNLEHTYLDYDLTLLRAIAAQAGVELAAPNSRAAAAELSAALQNAETVDLLLSRLLPAPDDDSTLKADTALALYTLIQAEGKLPAAPFIRRWGDARPLGTAALARERPWETPANATEALFFNGLIGRAFMESNAGPQEFFFIPSDLLPALPTVEPRAPAQPAEAIAPAETGAAAHVAGSLIVDDAVTLMAAIQMGKPLDSVGPHMRLPALDLLQTLLRDLNLLGERKLNPEPAKNFLRAARAEQLRTLVEAWRDSKTWNDLLHVPSLRPEPGAWRNDPLATRAFVIRLCADLPVNEWRSLDSFVAFVREHHTDFQRQAGDYDSWYLRSAATGEFLRGFEHWEEVDGALLRYLILGPMHWLGLADKSAAGDAFRLTPIFSALIGAGEWAVPEEPKLIVLKPDGVMIVSRAVDRYDRFQAARIGEWLSHQHPFDGELVRTLRASSERRGAPPSTMGLENTPMPAAQEAHAPQSKDAGIADAGIADAGIFDAGVKEADAYFYRLTGNSLQAAARQGITARHIVPFLKRACDDPPSNILELVERWGRKNIEVRATQTLVLHVDDSELLDILLRSPQVSRHLGERLGETAIEVKDWERLQTALVGLGVAVEYLTPIRSRQLQR
jgi:hypothetical protein